MAAAAATAGCHGLSDLAYVTNGSPSQKLDLYLPKEGRNLPLIVFIHAGAFYMGDKRQWIHYQLDYLNQGYAIASINYRLSSEAVFPAQIDDCKSAVRWLRAHAAQYRLDPNHFVAWALRRWPFGGDAGSDRPYSRFRRGGKHLVFEPGTSRADFFGPTDLTRLRPDHLQANSPESKFIGCSIKTIPTGRVVPAGRLRHEGLPPFLIVHVTPIRLFPVPKRVAGGGFEDRGVPVTFYTVKGAKHGGFTIPKCKY